MAKKWKCNLFYVMENQTNFRCSERHNCCTMVEMQINKDTLPGFRMKPFSSLLCVLCDYQNKAWSSNPGITKNIIVSCVCTKKWQIWGKDGHLPQLTSSSPLSQSFSPSHFQKMGIHWVEPAPQLNSFTRHVLMSAGMKNSYNHDRV